MRFVTSSDKELWVYSIGNFRIPVFATPGHIDGKKHWRIVAAVFLRQRPFDAISELLNPIAVNRFTSFWVIRDEDFKAEKAPGVTPDFYAVLSEERTGPRLEKGVELVEQIRQMESDRLHSDDFIKDVWQRTSVCELPLLRLIWFTICQEIPRWLMSTNKPIDLGWGHIRTFPYRCNWKQIMLSKFDRVWSLLKLPKEEREAKLSFTDFKEEMTSTDMAALVKAGPNRRAIRWTVELDPNNLWWEYSDMIEKGVLEGTTKTSYLKRYATLLHKMYPVAMETFRRFVQQTTLPSAAVLAGRGNRGRELVDHVHPGEVRPRNPEGLPVRVTSRSDGMAIRDSSNGRLVACETARLPEVPVVDFDSRDMRDAGGDGGTGERANGSGRMLVQHADGGETPGESVLGESEQPDIGVAGQTDA